jgi:hypothetical protein
MKKHIRQEPRNYFRIVVAGKDFDADQRLQEVALPWTSIWRRGKEHEGRIADSSGVRIDLGDGDVLDVSEQQEIAADFLELHGLTLRSLLTTPGVETCYLGLQESVMIDSLGSIMDMSPRLMKIVLELEIQLTIWSCTVRPAEP